MGPSPDTVLAAVKRSGVHYILQPGWNDPKIAASGTWNPAYVIQHHTANGGKTGNAPSLAYVMHDPYYPIRACHFLIGRDGTVFVVYALKCYHAGKGGPGHWGDGPQVPLDSMNGAAYGIEIESKGTSLVVDQTNGITPAQYKALARLNAALLDMLHAHGEGRIINHRTWAPTRKTDTRDTDTHLQAITTAARKALNAPVPLPPTAAHPVVHLDDLKFLRKSESNLVAQKALVKAGYLKPSLLRSYWSVAASGAFGRWKTAHGPFKSTTAAWAALGKASGFTVV